MTKNKNPVYFTFTLKHQTDIKAIASMLCHSSSPETLPSPILATISFCLTVFLPFFSPGIMLVVISAFYLLGWQLGAVEAVSLSILVGSSVDYCIHLIEGFLMADELVPASTTVCSSIIMLLHQPLKFHETSTNNHRYVFIVSFFNFMVRVIVTSSCFWSILLRKRLIHVWNL